VTSCGVEPGNTTISRAFLEKASNLSRRPGVRRSRRLVPRWCRWARDHRAAATPQTRRRWPDRRPDSASPHPTRGEEGQPRGVREQVVERQPRVGVPAGDPELRQIPHDRVLDVQPACVPELQHSHACEDLGDRVDPEDRVGRARYCSAEFQLRSRHPLVARAASDASTGRRRQATCSPPTERGNYGNKGVISNRVREAAIPRPDLANGCRLRQFAPGNARPAPGQPRSPQQTRGPARIPRDSAASPNRVRLPEPT
jgi:hypothetical protein